jgi:hypothetical protein
MKNIFRTGLICFIFSGCQFHPTTVTYNSPITYKTLCGLSQAYLGKMNDRAVRNWMEEKYGAYEIFNDPTVPQRGQNTIVVYGEVKPQYNDVYYLRNGFLFRISRNDIKEGPTFGHVVEGLGSPDGIYYNVEMYEQFVIYIQLDYPHLGISLITTFMKDPGQLLHNGKYAIRLETNIPVQRIECYTPDPMDLVLENELFMSQEVASTYIQNQIPWPGFMAYLPLSK